VSIIREQGTGNICSRIIEQLIENKNVKLKIIQRAYLVKRKLRTNTYYEHKKFFISTSIEHGHSCKD